MKEQDFSHIRYFTKEEVELTGAKIEDVKYETMRKMDDFRHMIGCGVHLIRNGITTGKHSSEEHPEGKAIDFILAEERKAETVFNALLTCGFCGIGVYWNTIMNSYHADLGNYRSWTGMKEKGGVWVYSDLIVNPQDQK